MPEKRGETAQSAEKPNIGSKALLGDVTLKKIAYYQSKTMLTDAELYSVAKEFFSELLEIKHEYTFSELEKEIDKTYFEQTVKDRIRDFVRNLRLVEYKSGAFSEEEVRKLLKTFEDLVPDILKTSLVSKNVGFSSMIKSMFSHKQNTTKKTEGVETTISSDEIMDRLEPYTEEESLPVKVEPKVESPPPEKKEEKKVSSPIEQAVDSLDAEEILPGVTDDIDWNSVLADNQKREETEWTKDADNSRAKTPEQKNIKSKVNLGEMIKKAKRTKSKDILKKQYSEIKHAYENLSNEQKQKYFDDIHELYEKLNGM